MTSAVLLDLYGTLVAPDWARLTAGRDAIADRAGVPREAARRAWAATHRRRMRGDYGALEQDLGAVLTAAGCTDAIAPDLLGELAAVERANWRDGVCLFADVMPALERLSGAGMRLAIVTNASAEAASVIPALGLDRRVDLVVASCTARALKPDLLERALVELGIPACDGLLADDEPQQVAAAERIGLDAVLVRRSNSDETSAAGVAPTHVVTDLAALSDLVLGAPSAPRR